MSENGLRLYSIACSWNTGEYVRFIKFDINIDTGNFKSDSKKIQWLHEEVIRDNQHLLYSFYNYIGKPKLIVVG